MSQPVIIKSNKYGINLILDPKIPFEELLGHITDKFWNLNGFSEMPRWRFPLMGENFPARKNIRF